MMNNCGCEAYFDMRYPEKSEIRYCPKHAATDDLLEVLEKIANYTTPDDHDRVGWVVAMETMQQLAAAAIALATKIED